MKKLLLFLIGLLFELILNRFFLLFFLLFFFFIFFLFIFFFLFLFFFFFFFIFFFFFSFSFFSFSFFFFFFLKVVAACASKEQADTHWEWIEEKLLANISYSKEERHDMFTWMLSKLKGK